MQAANVERQKNLLVPVFPAWFDKVFDTSLKQLKACPTREQLEVFCENLEGYCGTPLYLNIFKTLLGILLDVLPPFTPTAEEQDFKLYSTAIDVCFRFTNKWITEFRDRLGAGFNV
jgi:hypothetical protein